MRSSFVAIFLGSSLLMPVPALAQMPSGGPPAVGVATVAPEDVRPTTEFNGRIEAIERLNAVARVTAFLEERLFTEGTDVKKGDLLFRLERAPFAADVAAKQAAVAQAQAQLDNANLTFDRADKLQKSGTGSQSTLDNAVASQRTAQAQLQSAKAALQIAQINLDYTEISTPIDGRIGRMAVTVGNVVSPSSGALVSVVSQDPMYVTFPVPTRKLIELQQEHAAEGGAEGGLRLRLRLPDGRLYEELGQLDFIDVNVAAATDSITVRGRIPNPVRGNGQRELYNDEFVRVVLEAVKPQQVLAVPRAAVMTDQQGDFVYVVGADKTAQVRRVKLGQSTAGKASVIEGLSPGETIIVEGVQRVRPNAPVDPQAAMAQTAKAE
ncbi:MULTISPECIES: efflux RND transporter periplasmic adaptor subunit [unclassified Xanthobacter]|uniref:efflux RND transporter periplasmic adaptor subunit n=1 Tax=unclassified Xanthobacter TaxID=2623496 RepID=UPI001F3DD81C|nr:MULTISPECIES: efflux RND transporter periplasmic adaptor subunit [unclassified Xanthobacter]